MSMVKRAKQLREHTPASLRWLWKLPRLLLHGMWQLRVLQRRVAGRWFARPGLARQIHLSWTGNPHDSFTVTWWTATAKNPVYVQFRAGANESWQQTSGDSRRSPGVSGWLHRVTVTGLQTDRTYHYRVSNDSACTPAWSPEFETRTAPPPGAADFSFAFVCDTGLIGRKDGNADGTAPVLAQLQAANPLFVIGAGDYAYANADFRFHAVGDAVDTWFEQYQPLLARIPIMAQYGNHEIYLTEQYRDWEPRFAHPPGFDDQRNFSFRVGDVHFTSLFVPNPPYPTREQLDWLDQDLAQARADASIRWLVVFQHEPIYGHGTSHPAIPAIREALMPIFARHRVDLHLSGHDQSYERTYPLAGGAAHDEIVTRELHDYRQSDGVLYAKISPGGKRSEIGHDFSRFTAPLPELIAVADDTAHHYAIVDVDCAGALRYRAYSLLADKSPEVLPELLDSFTISAA